MRRKSHRVGSALADASSHRTAFAKTRPPRRTLRNTAIATPLRRDDLVAQMDRVATGGDVGHRRRPRLSADRVIYRSMAGSFKSYLASHHGSRGLYTLAAQWLGFFALGGWIMIAMSLMRYVLPRSSLGDSKPLGPVALAIWSALAPVLTTLTFVVLRKRRRLIRKYGRACVDCGYRLDGNMTGICPECGTRIDGKVRRRQETVPRRPPR